jgi:hypothetical protein
LTPSQAESLSQAEPVFQAEPQAPAKDDSPVPATTETRLATSPHDAPWELTPWDHEASPDHGVLADGAVGEHPAADMHAAIASSSSDSEHYNFGPSGESASAMPGATPGAAWRNFQQQPSGLGVVGRFVGMAVCGLLGIAFAYLVLSVISPTRFDYLNLWGRYGKVAPQENAEEQPQGEDARYLMPKLPAKK